MKKELSEEFKKRIEGRISFKDTSVLSLPDDEYILNIDEYSVNDFR